MIIYLRGRLDSDTDIRQTKEIPAYSEGIKMLLEENLFAEKKTSKK